MNDNAGASRRPEAASGYVADPGRRAAPPGTPWVGLKVECSRAPVHQAKETFPP
jgi:hypothetical protein